MRLELLVGICLALGLPLAGCSGSGDGPGQKTSQASAEDQAAGQNNEQDHGHSHPAPAADHAHPGVGDNDSSSASGPAGGGHAAAGKAASAGTGGQGNGAAIKPDTPEALIKKLELSLKAADFDAWNDIYAAPYGPVLIEWNRALDINNAQQHLADALRAQFPEDAPQERVDFHQQMIDSLKQLESLTVTNKVQEEDHVRMMIKVVVRPPGQDEPTSRTDSMLAIRQNDEWRLIPPMVEQQGMEVLQRMIAARGRLASRLEAIAENVQSGKYQSMPEVEVAVQQAQMAMMQEIHPKVSHAHEPKSNVEDPFQR